MSLGGALNIGRSALNASQLAIQVTGNNVANASTAGYSRQIVGLNPTGDGRFGNAFIGRGVDVSGIRRQADSALQQRLWSSLSQEGRANSDLNLLSNVETALDPLGNNNLAARLGSFFNSWSNLADQPGTAGNRSLVVQSGRQLASYVRDLRANLVSQRDQVDTNLQVTTVRANDLLDQVASLNTQIVLAEGGQGESGALRDQRDALVTELSRLVDVTPLPQQNGTLDLLVGSTPVVLAGRSRGVELKITTVNGATEIAVVTKDNKETLPITQGELGSLLNQRTELVNDAIVKLDEIATNLIARVNRLHSVGTSSTPLRSATGTLSFGTSDQTLAFNDPANQTISLLPAALRPESGSFTVTVTNTATGAKQTRTIQIDLDGINNSFAPGFTDDTSLDDLRLGLNGISNLSASVTADGKLKIDAATGYEITLSDDTSGVLAALGINTYFKGKDAQDIAVRDELSADPNLINAGQVIKGDPSANGAAMAIAGLRTERIKNLGNVTLTDRWDQTVQNIAVRTSAAKTNAGATRVVRENLDAQRSSLSGVSLDEEAINLLSYQRAYQASARFISTVDELTQSLLAIIR